MKEISLLDYNFRLIKSIGKIATTVKSLVDLHVLDGCAALHKI